MSARWWGWLALAVWVSGILGANVLIDRYGMVTLVFPAGVWAAGLTFTARDVVQERLGRRWVAPAVLGGALLSAAVSPELAVASGVAFGCAELADWLVYEPLRARDWYLAVLASGVVGSVVDSLLFLQLAGLPVAAGWLGMVVAKVAVVAATAVAVAPLQPFIARRGNPR